MVRKPSGECSIGWSTVKTKRYIKWASAEISLVFGTQSIFILGLQDGREYTCMKSVNLSKLRGIACVVKIRNTMQKDFGELEKLLET